MDRRAFLTTVGAAGTLGTAGCGDRAGSGGPERPDDDADPEDESGDPGDPETRFRLRGGRFEVAADGGFDPFALRGINLGMAKPGRFPGEAAITRAEYDRWLAAMGELNANVVRVYTVHPPAFYRALADYNRGRSDPIYLLHGNWIGEEVLREAGDVFAVSASFDRSLRRVVDVVHGETTVDPEPGHASGTFDADVSEYVAGYPVGIEWPPTVVRETNRANDPGPYEGRYLSSTVDRPFERWLAGRLDEAVDYEAAEYGVQRPVAFTNWVTTDPLDHPYEPFDLEDAVSVDPDAVVATDRYDAGTFAAYHVYPYYPPLLNETPAYADYVDHRGEPNSYAGYLNDLVSATDHPLVVAEFGVPSSRGISQRDVHGRDHGGHTEAEQGEVVAAMYEDVREAGTAGGLVFSWQNEWFKRTWNFEPLSDPDRRPEWSNVQTPEQRFGLLAFDPDGAVPLDGSVDAWTDATAATPAGRPAPVADGSAAGARELTAVRVTSDAAYLSVRLEFADLGSGVDWSRTNYLVTLGTTGRGATTLPYGVDADAPPTDFVVRLGGPDASRVTVDARYDPLRTCTAARQASTCHDTGIPNRGGSRRSGPSSTAATPFLKRASGSRSNPSRPADSDTGTGTPTRRNTIRSRTSTSRRRRMRSNSGYRGSSSTSRTRAAAVDSATSGRTGWRRTNPSRRSTSRPPRTCRRTPPMSPTPAGTRGTTPNRSTVTRTSSTPFRASTGGGSGRPSTSRRRGTPRPTRNG